MRMLNAVVAVVVAGLMLAQSARAQDDVQVRDIKAVYRNGQTFVTFTDAAEGEAAAKYRYSLYRSDKPITAENLAAAELCYHGVLPNSAKQFGYSFTMKDRLDPSKPTAVIEEGGKPLPMWSGLAVRTIAKDGDSYYAVVVTDEKYQRLGGVTPGQSATTEAVAEKVAPIQPIKVGDSKTRGQYASILKITGTKNLPLRVELHASQGAGGAASGHGDLYLYFGTPQMGWRDGLPGIFSVGERDFDRKNRSLLLDSRDAIVSPAGQRAMETYWFGYLVTPQWAPDSQPRTYPFTENRMRWIIEYVIKKYEADPRRVTCGGGSMGAWGSTTFALRQDDLFAAVYPNRPRTRQKGLPSLAKLEKGQTPLMPDGKTSYFDRMNMVKFVTEHPGDLPFYGWCCGRRDGFATWAEQIDMVKALTAAHHGFAFAWNDGDHSSGSRPMGAVQKYYPREKFAMDQSYPAFGNSSIDGNMGNGDPKDGDMEGGINLGFDWKDVVDEAGKWAVTVSNELAKAEMTVDITPRRCQQFKAKAGEKFAWSNSAGGTGEVTADANGLVTVEKVKIQPGQATTLTITRK